jgi:hypothetical protein
MQGLPEDIVEDILTWINTYLDVLPSPIGAE